MTAGTFPAEDAELGALASRAGADGSVSSQSSPAAKVHLFRSLFRGREDVYPRRFESRKTGRAGYQPNAVR